MVRVLDRFGAEIEVDLVHPIARALVVDQGGGTELRDGEKAGAGDVFVAPGAPAPGRHVGGDREPGKVVAGQEPFRREIPVRVEVAFVDAFGLGEEANLAFGLRAQPSGMVALGIGPEWSPMMAWWSARWPTAARYRPRQRSQAASKLRSTCASTSSTH